METRSERPERNETLRELTAAESAAVIGGVDDIVPVRPEKVALDR